uniref:Uncharacterized protein n=1 Tax=Glossina brevipalpis TaxID=37001 RepID=A0A1A9WUG9_9MUSC
MAENDSKTSQFSRDLAGTKMLDVLQINVSALYDYLLFSDISHFASGQIQIEKTRCLFFAIATAEATILLIIFTIKTKFTKSVWKRSNMPSQLVQKEEIKTLNT